MKVKDFKRILLYKCAERLRSLSEFIMGKLETDKKRETHHPVATSSYNGIQESDALSNKAEGSQKPKEWGNMVSAGPPEHWVELVRRKAPELLQSFEEEDREHNIIESSGEKESATIQQQGPVTHEKPRLTSRHVDPHVKKKIPQHSGAVPKVETSEQSDHEPKITAKEDTTISGSSELKKKIPQHRGAVPKVGTSEQPGHQTKITAKENTTISGSSELKKKSPQHRGAVPKVGTSEQPGHQTKITAKEHTNTSESSQHMHSVMYSKDRRHNLHKESSRTAHTGDTEKKLFNIPEKVAEAERLFEPGEIFGTTRKSNREQRDSKEKVVQAPSPITSRNKPLTDSTQHSETTVRSSTISKATESVGKSSKDLWPELPKEPSTDPDEVSSSVLSSQKLKEDLWPELPEAPSTKSYDEWITNLRELERLHRLDMEQRGMSWNV